MQKLAFVLLGLTLLVTACGGGAGSTPEDSWRAYQAAAKAGDYGAVYDMVAPADLPEILGMQASPGMDEYLGIEKEALTDMDPRDFFIAFLTKTVEKDPEDFEKMKSAEFKEVKVEGDQAVVTSANGDDESKDTFVLVDGKWYLSFK